MFAELESLFHRLRRRVSRSEWAIRALGFTTCDGTAEEPGLLLIQIDGLSRRQMERAVAEGRMPFLRSLVARNGCTVRTFYPGLPSTTPAVQGELFYGMPAVVPAFRYKERSQGRLVSLFDPDQARDVEARLAAHAQGLLEGGSSWSNIYRGGASEDESHFCVASLGFSDAWRAGKWFRRLAFVLMQSPAVVRIAALVVLELLIGLADAIGGILLRRQPVLLELGMVLSRMCVGIGLREVVAVGVKVDLARGLPIVHVNFLGYDEAAHRRGPGSRFAHWTLRGIDRAVRILYRAAHRSRRRDYHVWIFSDHGQERTRSFSDERGGVEKVIAEALKTTPPLPRPEIRRWPFRRRADRSAPAEAKSEDASFEVAAMGPVGHLYLREPHDLRALAETLIRDGGIPGILRRDVSGCIVWHYRGGEALLPDAAGRLRSHPPELRAHLARDLARLAAHQNAGDLVLLGWDPDGEAWTFPSERGSHAGAGPEETQGFLVLPAGTSMTSEHPDFVRPSELRVAALQLLGRRASIPSARTTRRRKPGFRLMTYNVHSCIGTDGRVSPRRIARVISRENPDVVAIQEVEHGRERSRGEDQAALIAEATGCHFAFCPAIQIGDERYGHAILSRHPIELVKMDLLPPSDGSIWPEPRAALWTRVIIDGSRVNLVTTHLGLSRAERLRQVEAVLGAEWIGDVLEKEPTIFCGDFNFAPASAAHRLLSRRMLDACRTSQSRVRTFASAKPFVQIDHIFHSRHFVVDDVAVVQNDASRVASDHLPLVADFRLV